jgi:hypothetical protein
MIKKQTWTIFMAACCLGLAACNGNDSDGTTGQVLGTDVVDGGSQPTPPDSGNQPPPVGTGDTPQIGDSCQTGDANHICLALKYVVYQNSSGNAVASRSDVLDNLAQINEVWAQCNIGFEIGEYVVTNPAQSGLNYNTSTSSELTKVRTAYKSTSELLVVSTGEWSGSLGSGSANAWTSMPGSPPYGSVLEASVATYPNIIAHELGHQLNLDHVSSTSNLMSPIIYTTSTQLTTSQCGAARSAAANYWGAMYR